MNISVLMENRASAGFASEHGLSLYIETGGQRILFDAGESGAFADNAARMNVDLSAVTFAVLSHAHHDHSGGMLRFLELNRDAPVYVSRYAHLPCSNAAGKPLSADPALFRSGRTVAVGERMHPAPGMTLCSCNRRRRPFPAETYGQTLQLRHGTVPDDYRHEQYLLICDGSRTVLFSGCSHKGIFNLLPFPALDGGKLVFLLIEGIFRRPLPKRFEIWVNLAGLFFLFAVMIFATVNDITRLF